MRRLRYAAPHGRSHIKKCKSHSTPRIAVVGTPQRVLWLVLNRRVTARILLIR